MSKVHCEISQWEVFVEKHKLSHVIPTRSPTGAPVLGEEQDRTRESGWNRAGYIY